MPPPLKQRFVQVPNCEIMEHTVLCLGSWDRAPTTLGISLVIAVSVLRRGLLAAAHQCQDGHQKDRARLGAQSSQPCHPPSREGTRAGDGDDDGPGVPDEASVKIPKARGVESFWFGEPSTCWEGDTPAPRGQTLLPSGTPGLTPRTSSSGWLSVSSNVLYSKLVNVDK